MDTGQVFDTVFPDCILPCVYTPSVGPECTARGQKAAERSRSREGDWGTDVGRIIKVDFCFFVCFLILYKYSMLRYYLCHEK